MPEHRIVHCRPIVKPAVAVFNGCFFSIQIAFLCPEAKGRLKNCPGADEVGCFTEQTGAYFIDHFCLLF